MIAQNRHDNGVVCRVPDVGHSAKVIRIDVSGDCQARKRVTHSHRLYEGFLP